MIGKNPFAARFNSRQPAKKAAPVGTTGMKTGMPMPGAGMEIGFPATNTNTGRTVSPNPANNSVGLIGGQMASNIR
jgi:hypothetical protein